MVFLIAISFSVAATTLTHGSYNSENNEITLTLSKGWNIIPFTRGGSSESDCDISAMYYWSPTDKIYVVGDPKKDLQEQPESFKSQLGRDEGLYCSTPNLGAYWVYSKNSCEIHTYLGYYNSWQEDDAWGVKDKILKGGWNFVTINPYMVGFTFGEILNDCQVEGINTWSHYSQSWGGISASSSSEMAQFLLNDQYNIAYTDVGEVFLIKVADACLFSTESSSSGPPLLPN